nr:hypothetical protein [Candidatus Sigynarchaeum springense]MDO8115673.1 hypothetical protein [Candidatus Sigynarchaeota archaeon]
MAGSIKVQDDDCSMAVMSSLRVVLSMMPCGSIKPSLSTILKLTSFFEKSTPMHAATRSDSRNALVYDETMLQMIDDDCLG